jgi:uncharacterized delta-60 repeat protein
MEAFMRLTRTRQHLPLFALAILLCSASYAAAQAGSLDPTFGTNGIVTTPMRAVSAVAIQSDGKIVLAGAGLVNDGITDTLVRLNTDGSLDASFGSGGSANFVPTRGSAPFGFFAMAIQSNGDIVAAGANSTEQGGYIYFAQVARVKTNGTLDASFGSGGFTTTTAIPFTPDFAAVESLGLALDNNGKILVASSYSNLMARFTSAGQLDTTFGTGGLVNLANPGPNATYAPTQIVVETNGKILVASGGPPPTPFAEAGTVSRYNSNGTLDTTFGGGGTAASVASTSAMLLQNNGDIVVAGSLTSKLNAPPASNATGFGVARYTSNGALDHTFGSGGVAVVDFGTNAPLSGAFAIAVQSNGELVAGGAAAQGALSLDLDSAFGLARFTTSGALDTSFGTGGLVTTTLLSGTDIYSYVTGLAIQSDGKIVAAGSTIVDEFFEAGSAGYVARYLAQ